MDWREVALTPVSTIETALRVLDRTAMQIVLVVSAEDILLGTLTDGDIRRAILKGANLADKISDVMNPSPVTAPPDTLSSDLKELMTRLGIRCVPLITKEHKVVGLTLLQNLPDVRRRPNPVLIMAGGRGERLKPLTDEKPKPLLEIAGQPLLEILLRRLSTQGFENVWISVHYRADDIVNAIGYGTNFDLKIHYLKEDTPLGTAGALRLLPRFEGLDPILICNADLLNGADFGAIVDHHVSNSAMATMAVSQHLTEIPFGVAHVLDGKLAGLEEKPIRRELISAGINVFNPEVLDRFPDRDRVDIPEVYTQLLKEKVSISVFELDGYWLDIGNMHSMMKAKNDHSGVTTDLV